MHTLDYKIKGLDWLSTTEAQRHSLEGSEERFKEAEERGQKVLKDILELMPGLELLSTTGELAVHYQNAPGGYRFTTFIDLYRSANPNNMVIMVQRYTGRGGRRNSTGEIRDLSLSITSESQLSLRNLEEEIDDILDEYKPNFEILNGPHIYEKMER